ncbi:hypothetical protein R3W88_015167 [Solanum pinnatisectum]|uniref:Uncharacterized protein n=1 Tax=Solanum pinnatisectum TaxID=50273 RepID=A0AAV9KTR2_9SOLN|nr:hypothetical protein R3W88_015167 [Solanum pinnatisectum]
MSKLSCSSISSSSTANVLCQCGVVVEMKTSWTQSNPGRRILIVNSINITKIRSIFRVFSSRTIALRVRSVLGGKWRGFSFLGLGNDYVALTCKLIEV